VCVCVYERAIRRVAVTNHHQLSSGYPEQIYGNCIYEALRGRGAGDRGNGGGRRRRSRSGAR